MSLYEKGDVLCTSDKRRIVVILKCNDKKAEYTYVELLPYSFKTIDGINIQTNQGDVVDQAYHVVDKWFCKMELK